MGEKAKSKDSEPRRVLQMGSVRKYHTIDGILGHSVVKMQAKLKRMVIKSTVILTDTVLFVHRPEMTRLQCGGRGSAATFRSLQVTCPFWRK